MSSSSGYSYGSLRANAGNEPICGRKFSFSDGSLTCSSYTWSASTEYRPFISIDLDENKAYLKVLDSSDNLLTNFTDPSYTEDFTFVTQSVMNYQDGSGMIGKSDYIYVYRGLKYVNSSTVSLGQEESNTGGSSTWWNTNWNKKTEITITDTAGIEINNYSIKLNINYDSDMQPDFDDLRFVNNAEDTELDYWIEEKIDSTSAIVWVKLPTLISSGDTTIYMYYGNQNTSSLSNEKNSFLFF